MKITIIIPVYNVEKYIDRCIESITRQTYRNLEIILVDDGSPDHCPQICDEYAKKDNRIKVVHKKNEGQGLARNDALNIASGDYVTFVDSDDFLAIDAIEKLTKASKYGLYDVVFSALYNSWIPEKGGTVLYSHNDLLTGNDGYIKALADLTAAPWDDERPALRSMGVWGGLYRTEIIKSNNIRFKSERIVVSEDLLFLYELLPLAKSIKYIPEPLYYYCLNTASTSHTFKIQYIDGIDFLARLLLKTKVAVESDEISRRIYKLYIYRASILQSQILLSDMSLKDKLNLSQKIYNKPIWKNIVEKYDIKMLPHSYKYYLSIFRKKRFFMAYFRQKLYCFKQSIKKSRK